MVCRLQATKHQSSVGARSQRLKDMWQLLRISIAIQTHHPNHELTFAGFRYARIASKALRCNCETRPLLTPKISLT